MAIDSKVSFLNKAEKLLAAEITAAARDRVLFGEGHERTIHRGFIESWQYHTLDIFIRRGWIYEAKTIKQ